MQTYKDYIKHGETNIQCPFTRKNNDKYKDNYNDNYMSIHCNAQLCSVYYEYVICSSLKQDGF